MITRSQIIYLLLENADKTQDEKREIVNTYCDNEGITSEQKAKIIADLESYVEF